MQRFFIVAMLAALAAAVASAQNTGVVAIRGVTLIDGTGRAPGAGATVVIDGSRIKDAGLNVEVPAGARTIDGSGKFLIPGLIDAHIHLRGGRGAGSSGRSAADQERDGVRALLSYL